MGIFQKKNKVHRLSDKINSAKNFGSGECTTLRWAEESHNGESKGGQSG